MALRKRYRVMSLLLSDSVPLIPQHWLQEWKALGSIIRRRVSVRLVQSHVGSQRIRTCRNGVPERALRCFPKLSLSSFSDHLSRSCWGWSLNCVLRVPDRRRVSLWQLSVENTAWMLSHLPGSGPSSLPRHSFSPWRINGSGSEKSWLRNALSEPRSNVVSELWIDCNQLQKKKCIPSHGGRLRVGDEPDPWHRTASVWTLETERRL